MGETPVFVIVILRLTETSGATSPKSQKLGLNPRLEELMGGGLERPVTTKREVNSFFCDSAGPDLISMFENTAFVAAETKRTERLHVAEAASAVDPRGQFVDKIVNSGPLES
jgi:hypothetical protein